MSCLSLFNRSNPSDNKLDGRTTMNTRYSFFLLFFNTIIGHTQTPIRAYYAIIMIVRVLHNITRECLCRIANAHVSVEKIETCPDTRKKKKKKKNDSRRREVVIVLLKNNYTSGNDTTESRKSTTGL